MEVAFSSEGPDRTIIKELVRLRQFKVDYTRVVRRNESLVTKLSELDVELTEMNVLLKAKEIENANLKKKVLKLSEFNFTGEMNELNALRERVASEIRQKNEFRGKYEGVLGQWVPPEHLDQVKRQLQEHIEELTRERDHLKSAALTQECHSPCKHTASRLSAPVKLPGPTLKRPPKTVRGLQSSPRHKKANYAPSFSRLRYN